MNAFARSNLAVATLRLTEARAKVVQVVNGSSVDEHERASRLMAVDWSIREALRLIEDAGALSDMESATTLPAPDSETRRVSG